MIVTLTPNPALDITYAVESVTLGASHRVGSVTERAGGKGLNVAAVLTAMGYDAIAVAPVGAGELAPFAADLTERRIRHRLVESPARTRRSIAVLDPQGEATLFNEGGEHQPEDVWSRVAETVERLAAHASTLTISGSVPAGAPLDLVARFAAEADRLGLRVVVDTGGPALTAALSAGPALVKPNRVEAEAALAARGVRVETVGALAAALVDAGATAALVSDGANGLALRHGDVALRAWLPEPLSGNPTGAGDALTAALAAKLDTQGGLPQGRDAWTDALRRGVAWSAAAVLQPLAGAVDPDDVERLLSAVEVEESLV